MKIENYNNKRVCKRDFIDKYSPVSILKVFCILLFLLTIPLNANDFYPLNITPENGAILEYGSSVPITFDVCLGYDYPASASEWHVEISIFYNNNRVYFETIQGFEANGPACYPISNVPQFNPISEGTYYIEIKTFYDQEINTENDLLTTEFVVKAFRDLAVVNILSPPQNMGGLTFFAGLEFDFIVTLRNEGNITISKNDYRCGVQTIIQGSLGENEVYYPSNFQELIDIEPGAEFEFKVRNSSFLNQKIPEHLNEQMQIEAYVYSSGDENESNNTLEGNTITYVPNPMWPNEIGTNTGLNKLSKKASGSDFIEFIVTDKFSKPELYKLSIYDSIGTQIDSTTLDMFTVGETVDSFIVYSYEFSGDVLQDNGAIAVSYDSLRFLNYFISWGGEITATEGLWKDSTSNDIGVTPVAGNSISLSGQGTDFSSFTWEVSTPTPGIFNDSQLVPVEEEHIVSNQFTLEQNYPNPFNPTTTINYTVPNSFENGRVKLAIYDLLGRELKILVNEQQTPGNYKIDFNGTDLSSGVYYYRITVGDFMETRKMSLLK